MEISRWTQGLFSSMCVSQPSSEAWTGENSLSWLSHMSTNTQQFKCMLNLNLQRKEFYTPGWTVTLSATTHVWDGVGQDANLKQKDITLALEKLLF